MTDFESQLKQQLEEKADEVADELADEMHTNIQVNIDNASQGADGLSDFLEEPEKVDTGIRQIKINHPTARLHEIGGPIEPTYTNAKVQLGYERDDFYEALDDCEEFVTRKNIVRNAKIDVKVDYMDVD